MGKGKIPKNIKWISIPIISVLMVACQGNILGYTGRVVDEKNLVRLKAGGPHSAVWNTRNVVLLYDYVNRGGRLEISGEVELTGGVGNFEIVEKLGVDLYFVDGGGRIIEHVSLFNAGINDTRDSWTFQRWISKPELAEAMAFGYSGQVRSVGSDPDTFDFWETPI
jgi:hypothetical protein